MVVNFGGSIVPGEDSTLRAQTRECDEILGLGHVQRLPVNARRHTDYRPASIAEWNRVYGFLHRAEISTAVVRHCDYPGRGRHESLSRTSRLSVVGKRVEDEDEMGR